MERILRGDEKIRKAEEIYYRRKMGLPERPKIVDESPKNYIFSKVILEILVIINLALIVTAVQNKDFIFTEQFLQKVAEYNVNLTQEIKSLLGGEATESTNTNQQIEEENTEEVTGNTENNADVTTENSSESNSEDNQNVEGANTQSEIVPNDEAVSSLNQMEQDIETIKQSYSFFKPLDEGTVTSLFGARTSVYQNVTGYHTGVDIGAKKGTSIKASIARNSSASFKRGRLWKTFKNTKW